MRSNPESKLLPGETRNNPVATGTRQQENPKRGPGKCLHDNESRALEKFCLPGEKGMIFDGFAPMIAQAAAPGIGSFGQLTATPRN